MPPESESNKLACVCNRSFPTLGALKGHRNRCFKWKSHKKILTQPDPGPAQIEGFDGPDGADQQIVTVQPDSPIVQVRKFHC